jgi:hypothetical protein
MGFTSVCDHLELPKSEPSSGFGPGLVAGEPFSVDELADAGLGHAENVGRGSLRELVSQVASRVARCNPPKVSLDEAVDEQESIAAR